MADVHGDGDFTIELRYCKWKVHQNIFAAASKYFATAMDAGRWKVCEDPIS